MNPGSSIVPVAPTASWCKPHARQPVSHPPLHTRPANGKPARALVGEGLAVALVPRLARLPPGYPVVRVPLRGEPTPARRILTSVRRGSRNQYAIAAALTALEEIASRHR